MQCVLGRWHAFSEMPMEASDSLVLTLDLFYFSPCSSLCNDMKLMRRDNRLFSNYEQMHSLSINVFQLQIGCRVKI